MSVTLAEGVVLITADGTKVPRDVARDIERNQGPLQDAGETSSRSFTDVFKGSFAGSWLGNLASDLTSQIGYAIGQGIRSAINFGIGTIDIASDLQESVNAVQVAYGDIGGSILAMGDTSAKTFGVSERDLNTYAVQFSAFSKSIAGEGGDVAGTFSSILGRATDFSSVMNLDVTEALGLFQSGLAGETEPLRKFGIDLSAATTEAYAYANGIAAPGEELTEQQKTLARYGSLLEQTSAVQGDFANTSDSLANANRTNAATWDDIQAKIGTGFLPIAESLAGVLSETVLPAIAALAEEYGPQLGEMFADLTPALEGFVTDVLPKLPELLTLIAETAPGFIDFLSGATVFVVDFAGKLALGAEQIGDFFTGITQGVEAAGVGFAWFSVMLYSNLSAIGSFFTQAAGNVERFFSGLGNAVIQGGQQIAGFAQGVGQWIGEAIGFIGSLPGRAGEALGNLGNTLYSSGRALIDGFIGGIRDSIGAVGDAVSGIVEWAAGFFPNSPAKRGAFSGAGWTAIGRSGLAIAEQFQSGINRADYGIPFTSTVGAEYGTIGSRSTITAPGASSGGGGNAPINVTINESTDPLGSAGRVGAELRKWRARA